MICCTDGGSHRASPAPLTSTLCRRLEGLVVQLRHQSHQVFLVEVRQSPKSCTMWGPHTLFILPLEVECQLFSTSQRELASLWNSCYIGRQPTSRHVMTAFRICLGIQSLFALSGLDTHLLRSKLLPKTGRKQGRRTHAKDWRSKLRALSILSLRSMRKLNAIPRIRDGVSVPMESASSISLSSHYTACHRGVGSPNCVSFVTMLSSDISLRLTSVTKHFLLLSILIH